MTEKPTNEELVQRVGDLEREAEKLRERREFFELLSESSPLGAFQTDGEGNVQYLNPKWLEITGLSREDALGLGWSGALHPADKPRVLEDWTRCIKEKTGYNGEFRFVTPSGKTVWTHTRTTPVFSSSGDIVSHVGVNEDITERRKAEEAGKIAEARLNTILESAQDGIFLMAFNTGERRYANQAMADMLGYSKQELLQQKFQDSVDPNTVKAFADIGRKMIRSKQAVYNTEYDMTKKDGSSITVSTTLAPLVDMGDRISDVVGIMRDITEKKLADLEKDRLLTELKNAEKELQKLARTDPLTGALNRFGFFERAHVEWVRFQRLQAPTSVIVMDCDNFKQINDTLGHQTGDLVLKVLVNESLAQIREVDIFGRFGGDEFGIILTETEEESALILSERLRTRLSGLRIPAGKETVRFTVSMGLTSLGKEDRSLEQVVNRADKALYEAKNTGRNRLCRA